MGKKIKRVRIEMMVQNETRTGEIEGKKLLTRLTKKGRKLKIKVQKLTKTMTRDLTD